MKKSNNFENKKKIKKKNPTNYKKKTNVAGKIGFFGEGPALTKHITMLKLQPPGWHGIAAKTERNFEHCSKKFNNLAARVQQL